MNSFRLLKPMLLLLFASCSLFLHAQDITVVGKVTEKETGKPMEGVTVKVKNNNTATVTDAEGRFNIKVPSSESILTFTSIDFQAFEVKAGSSGVVNAALDRSNSKMDEVIVVGYGTRKRVNVQGAVSTIKAAEIEDIPVANLPSALVNRVPGVSVNFSSGKPGSTTTLNLRNSSTAPA